MYCKTCGGLMLGDGYRTVPHCEFAEWEDHKYQEPDAPPIYCKEKE